MNHRGRLILRDLEKEKIVFADLLLLSDEFQRNRSFDCWSKPLGDTVRRVPFKERTLPKMPIRQIVSGMPVRIVVEFLKVVFERIILNGDEFLFNPRAAKKRQITLRINYLMSNKKAPKNRNANITHGGLTYFPYLKYPKNRCKYKGWTIFRFEGEWRKLFESEVLKGRLYYNNEKEKLIAML